MAAAGSESRQRRNSRNENKDAVEKFDKREGGCRDSGLTICSSKQPRTQSATGRRQSKCPSARPVSLETCANVPKYLGAQGPTKNTTAKSGLAQVRYFVGLHPKAGADNYLKEARWLKQCGCSH
jgi:hypothetical protein